MSSIFAVAGLIQPSKDRKLNKDISSVATDSKEET
jgi:hypothetical protein